MMAVIECESCAEGGFYGVPAVGHSSNPEWSGYNLCQECIDEYDRRPPINGGDRPLMEGRYAGWNIEYVVDEAGFGDMTGLNVPESMESFCTVLAEELAAEFPGAEIHIARADAYNNGIVNVWGHNDYARPSQQPWEGEAANIRESVETVANRILVYQSDRWIIEQDDEPGA